MNFRNQFNFAVCVLTCRLQAPRVCSSVLKVLLVCIILICISCDEKSGAGSALLAQQEPQKMDSASALFQRGDFEGAIKVYDEILAGGNLENFYTASYNKAYCYYRLQQFEPCRNVLKVVMKVPASDTNYRWFIYNSHFMLGRMFGIELNYDSAVAQLRQAMSHGDGRDILSTLTYYESRSEQYEDALEHANQALSFDSTSSNTFANRSLVYVKLKQPLKAIEDADKAILLDSKNPYSYMHRALAMISMNKTGGICDDLHNAELMRYKDYSSPAEATVLDSLLERYCNSE